MKSIIMWALQFLFLFCVCLSEIIGGDFYTRNGAKYYVSYPLKKNYHEAFRFCAYNGMHLIDMHTYEEDQIVRGIALDNNKKYNATQTHFWTSGTDLGHPVNSFYWATTGHEFVYTNWMAGQPNNLFHGGYNSSEDCIGIDYNYDYTWNDTPCGNMLYVMCRDRLIVPATVKSQQQCEL